MISKIILSQFVFSFTCVAFPPSLILFFLPVTMLNNWNFIKRKERITEADFYPLLRTRIGFLADNISQRENEICLKAHFVIHHHSFVRLIVFLFYYSFKWLRNLLLFSLKSLFSFIFSYWDTTIFRIISYHFYFMAIIILLIYIRIINTIRYKRNNSHWKLCM